MTHNLRFKVTVLCKGECFKTVHLSHWSLQIIHLLNRQCNVALTRGSLAIAEPLVYPKVCDITVRRQRSAVAVYSGNRFTLACRNGWESNTWILPAAFRRHATDTTYRDRVVAASRRQRSLSCPQPGASTARQLPTHLPGADLVRSWISAAIQQLHHCCWLLSGQLSTAYCRHITFDLAWKKALDQIRKRLNACVSAGSGLDSLNVWYELYAEIFLAAFFET